MPSHISLLSSLDCYHSSYYVPIFLIFRTDDPVRAIASLNRGLEKTCLQLPYVKGSVVGPVGNLSVTWEDDDPPVQLAEISNSGSPSYAELEAQGLPLHHFHRGLISVSPGDPSAGGKAMVWAVSSTVIEGGLIIGTCILHNAMDGTGMAHLYERWAYNTRNGDSFPSTAETLLGRNTRFKDSISSVDCENNVSCLLRQHTELELIEIEVPAVSTKEECVGPATLVKETTPATTTLVGETASTPASPLRELCAGPIAASKLFVFSARKLGYLQDLLVSQAHQPLESRPSKNTVLLALLWSQISLIRLRRFQRQVPDDEAAAAGQRPSTLKMAVDVRKHVFDTVSNTTTPYTGNLVLDSLTTLPFAELACPQLQTSTPPIHAEEIYYPTHLPFIIKSITTSLSTLSIHSVAEMHVILTHTHHPTTTTPKTKNVIVRQTNPFTGANLVATSWANLPLYQDFGAALGAVQYVRVPMGTSLDGIVMVLPRKWNATTEEVVDRFEVGVGLLVEDMHALEGDAVLAGFRS